MFLRIKSVATLYTFCSRPVQCVEQFSLGFQRNQRSFSLVILASSRNLLKSSRDQKQSIRMDFSSVGRSSNGIAGQTTPSNNGLDSGRYLVNDLTMTGSQSTKPMLKIAGQSTASPQVHGFINFGDGRRYNLHISRIPVYRWDNVLRIISIDHTQTRPQVLSVQFERFDDRQ